MTLRSILLSVTLLLAGGVAVAACGCDDTAMSPADLAITPPRDMARPIHDFAGLADY